MKTKFHAISMCTLMAAFATSSWAAAVSSCPKGFTEGDGKTGEAGVCYYDILDGEQAPTVPANLTSFKLRYDGSYDITKATVNLDNSDGTNFTFSVKGSAQLKNGGALTIKNRFSLVPYVGAEMAPFLSLVGLQAAYTEGEMSKCSAQNCNIAKETGLNALAIEFTDGVANNGQSFELAVTQEQFDFKSLKVYHTKSLSESTIEDVATKAGASVPADFPLDKIKDVVKAGIESVALIDGISEKELEPISSNIDVAYVYLDRTFAAGDGDKASTIALPFGIATDNIFGALEILKFSRVANNTLYMNVVYCSTDNKADYCPAKNGKSNGSLEAYKPYLIRLKSGASALEFSGPATLAETPTVEGYTDFSKDNWAFRAVFAKKTWAEGDEELDGCSGSCAYGYAAKGTNQGKFVRIGKGAYIFPFRGYLVNTNPSPATPLAPANASYVLRPTVNTPDELDIAVEGDNDQTTVIGKFNTRTGEIHINNMKHTYDLKGRRVNGTNNARGAYYGKKVLMK